MFGRKWSVAQEGNWSDFETEALPCIPDLYRLSVWLTRNKDEAEDLVQETLTEALKSFRCYEAGTNCRAWLTTIMYRLNSKRLHARGRIKIADEPEEKLAETILFEAALPEEEIIETVKQLPEIFRQVVVLSDVEAFTYKEIATILQIPIGTVISFQCSGAFGRPFLEAIDRSHLPILVDRESPQSSACARGPAPEIRQ